MGIKDLHNNFYGIKNLCKNVRAKFPHYRGANVHKVT